MVFEIVLLFSLTCSTIAELYKPWPKDVQVFAVSGRMNRTDTLWRLTNTAILRKFRASPMICEVIRE